MLYSTLLRYYFRNHIPATAVAARLLLWVSALPVGSVLNQILKLAPQQQKPHHRRVRVKVVSQTAPLVALRRVPNDVVPLTINSRPFSTRPFSRTVSTLWWSTKMVGHSIAPSLKQTRPIITRSLIGPWTWALSAPTSFAWSTVATRKSSTTFVKSLSTASRTTDLKRKSSSAGFDSKSISWKKWKSSVSLMTTKSLSPETSRTIHRQARSLEERSKKLYYLV